MSEAQRNRRDKYIKNRKRLIWIQATVLIGMAVLIAISAITYAYISRTYYVDYTERSDVNYSVSLLDNDFFENNYVEKDHNYVATLIDNVYANFVYDLYTDEEDVNYEYSYGVEAQLLINKKNSDEPIFDPIYVIQPEERASQNAKTPLRINHSVLIDYAQYNDLAQKFVETYDLTDTESALVVRMNVKVHSTAADVGGETSNAHVVELHIPLVEKAVDIEMTSSVPVSETKQIACNGSAGKAVFLVATIVLTVLALFLALFLVAFVLLTRTKDTTYAGKLKRLLNNYKSYIQRIMNPFNRDGYQVIFVNSFEELLEIRETIQAPILMYENEDQTCTEFVIPAHSTLLYIYILQVEGFTDIFEEEPVAEPEPEPEPEPIVVIEPEPEPEPEGVEVIGVVWPEHKGRENEKIYRYDPDGEKLDKGDIVLVPSRDECRARDIVREAEVAEPNHYVDPATLKYPLKKIVRVVRRKAEELFTSMIMNEGKSAEADAENENSTEE
ncbi:MAG: hypothetical protein J6L85_08150 [Clostridia bacterium]|nr:hypothetical protein [Clostridia bacterium]